MKRCSRLARRSIASMNRQNDLLVLKKVRSLKHTKRSSPIQNCLTRYARQFNKKPAPPHSPGRKALNGMPASYACYMTNIWQHEQLTSKMSDSAFSVFYRATKNKHFFCQNLQSLSLLTSLLQKPFALILRRWALSALQPGVQPLTPQSWRKRLAYQQSLALVLISIIYLMASW